MKWIWFFAVLAIMVSCNTEIKRLPEPENLIPRDTMVMILQDLTVLEAHITNQYPQINRYQKLMLKSGDKLLKKFDVSYDRFNASLDYYGSRQEEMISIYSEVQDSLTFKMNRLQ